MSKVSFLSRGKRVLVWCAATALLHSAVLGWVSGHIRPLQLRHGDATPAPIFAQLRLALPKPAPAPVQAVPRPAPRPAPRPRPAPPPPAAAPVADQGTMTASTAAESEDTGTGDEPTEDAAAAKAQQAGAPETPAPVESPQDPAARAASTPEAQPAPALEPEKPRHYKVSLPPSAELAMTVARREADGTERNGSGAQTWQTDGHGYKVSVEVGISLLVTRLNLLVTNSEGSVDDFGLAPVTYTEKRVNRAMTATHFRRADGKISFSTNEGSFDLLPGAQDFASLPFQLAAIGRGDPAQLTGTIDIQVADSRDASVYRFEVVGQEPLETPLGTLKTVHLSRPPRPGSYSSKLDVWLAPDRGWYPVQVRNTEGSGAVTTQSVSRIDAKE